MCGREVGRVPVSDEVPRIVLEHLNRIFGAFAAAVLEQVGHHAQHFSP